MWHTCSSNATFACEYHMIYTQDLFSYSILVLNNVQYVCSSRAVIRCTYCVGVHTVHVLPRPLSQKSLAEKQAEYATIEHAKGQSEAELQVTIVSLTFMHMQPVIVSAW